MTMDLIATRADAISASTLLRSTKTVRDRAHDLLARARAGESAYFTVVDAALAPTAKLVAEVTRQHYPNLQVPYPSCWRHMEAGGVQRVDQLTEELGKVSIAKRARAQIDLALVTVLLGAGAGPDWSFTDPRTGQKLSRSEGLAVASFNAFTKGLFSSKPTQPCQADALGLQSLTSRQLGDAFQVGVENPLVGLEGRAALLRRLGEVIAAQPEVFGGAGGLCRPGRLFDHLVPTDTDAPTVAAHAIVIALLSSLAPIWPALNAIKIDDGTSIALGDCWPHSAVVGEGASAGWMPLHNLSQFAAYSLLEPLEWADVAVTGLDALTGLAESRNGGLLLDNGVLVLKDPALATQALTPSDECIVEWRALTIALLDELAPLVRAVLGLTAAQLPLVSVLQGGTWAAGRALAQRLRGGMPALNIVSDGTVY